MTENIQMNVEDPENIFVKEKPVKKKRTLTPAQLEGLAKGRKKVRENRLNKQKESAELKKEQREQKKELTKAQKRQRDSRKKMLENEKLENWEDKKYEALGKLNCSMAYKTMESYLNTLTRAEILDDEKLKDRLQFMVRHLEQRK